jgi:WG containing repeat
MFKRSIAFLVCLVFLCVCVNAHAQGEASDKLFPVVMGGKWGYIDRSGKLVIKPQFDGAHPFYDGIAKVMTGTRFEKEKWSYINTSGKPIFKDLSVNRLENFSEGLGAVCLYKQDEIGYLCGYMDKSGSWAIEPKFYSSMSFQDGLARTAARDRNSKTGTRQVYIDKTGNEVIELSTIPTQNSNGFSEGLARFAISVPGKEYLPQGFVDKTGKVVIEPKFEAAGDFSEGLAAVMFFKPPKVIDYEKDDPYEAGFIDTTGKIVIKPQFEFYRPFSEGLAFVMIRGRIGAIDKTGKVVIRPQFFPAAPKSTPYWEVLDYYPEWNSWTFSEGLAVVHRGGRWGYIDKTGKFVIQPLFGQAYNFSGGLALVIVGNRVGYIDKTGRFIWNPSR